MGMFFALAVSLTVTFTDTAHELMAVDPAGTAYGTLTDPNDDGTAVWASTDNGRTWAPRGSHPSGYTFARMTALSDGVLLADVMTPSGNVLTRSADGGLTWTDVLPMAPYRTLSPHSFDELNGIVYFGEYQDFQGGDTPINLWMSADRGLTWTVVKTFRGHRHCHAVRTDPATKSIWMFFGDVEAEAALVRSTDGGVTWTTMQEGELTALSVDGTFTPKGLLYSLDVNPPDISGILRLAPDGTATKLATIPGPSYSLHQLKSGGFLSGVTRETNEFYPPENVSAHLFGSLDGDHWTEVAQYPRTTDTDYSQADVYWELKSGEAVVHFYNVQLMPNNTGYQLVKLAP